VTSGIERYTIGREVVGTDGSCGELTPRKDRTRLGTGSMSLTGTIICG
jgi:hypothetical protein